MDQDTSKYAEMLNEMLLFKPETIKVPSRDGGYVRLPVITNCPWYRELCAAYTRFRRGRQRTIIKRCHTVMALKRMLCGDRETIYAQRIMLIAADYVIDTVNQIEESEYADTSF
jgi:hypothetical protein